MPGRTELTSETNIPRIWYLFIFSGFIYALIGVITFFMISDEKNITHLPAWFRRIIDGFAVCTFGVFVTRHPNRKPWRGWFTHQELLSYTFLSLIIHYGGMLPPI
ncbi:MAG: hypothetical protein ACXAD7_04145, partial [Candidatus Kariarchaeaceae archaeon]